MTARRMAIVLAVAMLILSACGPGEISSFLEDVPSEDLTQSSDPALRAAGESAKVVEDVARSEALLREGIENGDRLAIFDAGTDRPTDPRFDFYEAALVETMRPVDQSLEETSDHWRDVGHSLNTAAEKMVALWPDDSPGNRSFRYREMYLDALRDTILNGPGTETEAYCHYMGEYKDIPEDRLDSEPGLRERQARFLAEHADFQPCGS